MKPYTVPEAARRLEISEYQVKKLIKSWKLELVKIGAPGISHLIRGEDVELILRERIRAGHFPHIRVVATIGMPDDVERALEISGLLPKPAANFLDALSAHHSDIRPIIITTPQQRDLEAKLYDAYAQDVWVAEWTPDIQIRTLIKLVWGGVQLRKASRQNP